VRYPAPWTDDIERQRLPPGALLLMGRPWSPTAADGGIFTGPHAPVLLAGWLLAGPPVSEAARWPARRARAVAAGDGIAESGTGRSDGLDAADRALMQRLAGGDERALEAIFLAHAERMHRIAYRYLRSSWAARAVVQDVFTAVWERRDRLDVRVSLATYLAAATRNRATTVLREELRRRERDGRWAQLARAADLPVGASTTPDSEARVGPQVEAVGDAAVRAAVERALAALPGRQRLVFQLRVERELSNAEVRELIGAVSTKAVELLFSRALKSLRTQLLPTMQACDARLPAADRVAPVSSSDLTEA
jgi:RNA polymerase sigma-70 factor (ECF subfamily)